jgi:hypothetical protein
LRGRPGTDHADETIIRPQLDIAGHQVEGALVGIAFLEQDAPRAELADMGLAGERMQILDLQTVEWRESSENCQISRSFIHRTNNLRLWF